MPFLRAKLFTLLAPTLSAGLLGGAAYIQRGWPEPADAEPYHARALKAVNEIPLRMGPWVGKDRPPQKAAIQVLNPNVIRNIELVDPRVSALRRSGHTVSMSIVQCKQFSNMIGHFPPNCYPNFGDRLTAATPRNWGIAVPAELHPLEISGMEYRFERVIDGRTHRRIVYNFMVAPKRGFLRDMNALQVAAEEYERRYFGAAQFQVVFDSLAGQELSGTERDEIFSTLMRSAAPALEVLRDDEPTSLAARPVPGDRR